MSIATLRSSLRRRRQALNEEDRRRKSLAITRNLSNMPQFVRAASVAFYDAMPEEVDTLHAIHLSQQLNKTCYLPIINQTLWRPAPLLFRTFVPGETIMTRNNHGIMEPQHRKGSGTMGQHLDLVCVPLVGFNDTCDRIGMGKGYYDQTFGRGQGRLWRKTFLVGLAFFCQRARFEPRAHDVRMDAIVTEAGILLPPGGRPVPLAGHARGRS